MTKKSKLSEITAYAHIRSQIKDDSLQAKMSESELASLFGCSERTIRTHIKTMKDAGLFIKVEKEKGSGDHRHNVYYMEELVDDYSMILPDILIDPTLSVEEIGLLILIKTHCIPGTNHMWFQSWEQLASLLNMDDERLKQMVMNMSGHLKFVGDALVITNPNILLYKDENKTANIIYGIIYWFCISKGVVPPEKNDTQMKNMSIINGKYANPDQFRELLKKRFPTLRKNVTLAYFAMGLNGIKYEKPDPAQTTITL